MDLTLLRPRSDTPDAVLEAISRCVLASRGAAVEIAHLRRVRSALLIAGHPAQIETNLDEIGRAMGRAMQIDELIEQLQAKSAKADHQASVTPGVDVATAIAKWWLQHGPTVLDGARLALAAIANTAATPATSATNVRPLRPQPAA